MLFPEFQELKTDRLILRRLSIADAPLYYSRIGSRPEVSRYMLWEPHSQLAETEALIRNLQTRYASGRCYRWCIALAEDDSPLGVIELLRFDEERESCSFAYMIGSDYWGSGYGTEALQAALDFAFSSMQVQAVIADHMAANPASGRVMQKAGMTFFRDLPGKYEKNGQSMDAREYRITRSQWLGKTD